LYNTGITLFTLTKGVFSFLLISSVCGNYSPNMSIKLIEKYFHKADYGNNITLIMSLHWRL